VGRSELDLPAFALSSALECGEGFVHGFDVESLGIETRTYPFAHFFVFRVTRLCEDFDEMLVSARASAILRRTRASSTQALDRFGARFEHRLHPDLVLPIIAEVVAVKDLRVLSSDRSERRRVLVDREEPGELRYVVEEHPPAFFFFRRT